jgi:hypothetical protein
VKRSITGRTAGSRMTLGELRRFIASIEGLADDVPLKVKTAFRGHLRSVTVEEADDTFHDYILAVGGDKDDDSDTD